MYMDHRRCAADGVGLPARLPGSLGLSTCSGLRGLYCIGFRALYIGVFRGTLLGPFLEGNPTAWGSILGVGYKRVLENDRNLQQENKIAMIAISQKMS